VSNSAPCYGDMRWSAGVTSLRWLWHYCAVIQHRAMTIWGGVRVWLHSDDCDITVQQVASFTPQPLHSDDCDITVQQVASFTPQPLHSDDCDITVQQVASFTPQPLYYPEGWVGPITGLGTVARRKISVIVRNQAPILCWFGPLLMSSLTENLWHSAKH
jgi:hypothetical protein